MNKKFKNINTWALAAALIAVVVLLNWVAGLAAQKVNLQLDVTENKDYVISDEIAEFIKSVDQPIKVYVLAEELLFKTINQYFYQINEGLTSFSRLNPNIEVEYVNLLKNPTFANKFEQFTVYDNDIILTSGEKSVYLGADKIFLTETDAYGQQTVSASQFESAFAAAVLELQSETQTLVTFLSGHGEEENTVAVLQSLLYTNNMKTVTANLYLEDIDPLSQIIVAAAPLVDYDAEIIEKLETFLDAGGQFLYFADVTQPVLPNLEAFLTKNGITIGEGVVFESDSRLILNYNVYFAIVEYLENAYSAELTKNNLPTTAPYARPMEETSSGNAQTVTLLRFSASSGIVPPNAEANWQYTADDIVGYIPAAVQADLLDGGKIVVIGSLAFADPSVLQTTSLGNAKYLLNIFYAMADKEDTVSIAPKTIEMQGLYLSTANVNLLGIIFIVAVPAVVLLAGVIVYRKRKNM